MSISIHSSSDKKYLKYLKNKDISPLAKFLSLTVKSQMEKWFKVRKELNREIVAYLRAIGDFKADLRRVRKQFRIPKLSPKEDIREIPFEDSSYEESDWLHGQKDSVQQSFHQEIEGLIKKYDLPQNFYDWLDYYILYGTPPFAPLYNPGLVQQIIKNPDEVSRIPLTSGEKKFLKQITGWMLGVKKRPNKDLKTTYKMVQSELQAFLATSKNKRRKFRTLSTALKTSKVGRLRKEYDAVSKRITYKDLIPDLYSEKEEEKLLSDEKKLKNTLAKLRKQRQRLKERTQLMLKKMKN